MRTVGVLAMQGDVPEHARALRTLRPAARLVLVRSPQELAEVDVLTIPGGESTTVAGLIDRYGLREPLRERIGAGLPTLGTCAGLILLARKIVPGPGGREPTPLGLLDITVRRNDYGGQRESFEAPVTVAGLSNGPFPGVFIRSPRILALGPGVSALAKRGEEIVGARHGTLWGLTFHPELSGDDRVLRAFLAQADRYSSTIASTAATTTAVPRATAKR